MNLVFVNTYCGKFGGVEQNIADVVAGLRQRGHKCRLVYEKETGKAPDAFNALFDTATRADTPARLTTVLTEHVQDGGIDAIYVHKLGSVRPLIPFKGNVRMIRMIHDHDVCCPRRHKYFTFSNRICTRPAGWRCWADLAFLERDRSSRLGVRFHNLYGDRRERAMNREVFDSLLVGSRFMREEVCMNGFDAARVRCLPPCVQLPDRTPSEVPDNHNLLFVGQLIKGKGVDLLLRAIANLTRKYRLTIAGDGNARPALEALAQDLGLQDSVTFAGWVPREKLEALYDDARILAVPSRWAEPFGMIGLEAMHRGRPVVAFAVGGIPDWLEDGVTGYSVAERDTSALSAAIDKLLSDIELARTMGRNGRKNLEAEFCFDHYLDELERAFGCDLAHTGGEQE